jgi:hypothetical protein
MPTSILTYIIYTENGMCVSENIVRLHVREDGQHVVCVSELVEIQIDDVDRLVRVNAELYTLNNIPLFNRGTGHKMDYCIWTDTSD